MTFAETLDAATGRYESSFASRLLATIEPRMPVIDSIVLRNLKLRRPRHGARGCADRIVDLHAGLVTTFRAFSERKPGRHLVERIHSAYRTPTSLR